MKKIIIKTRKEIENETTYSEVKVRDLRYFYFVCDVCKIAFFEDDTVLQKNTGGVCCPIKKGILDRVCKNRIYSGDEASFYKYYKLED